MQWKKPAFWIGLTSIIVGALLETFHGDTAQHILGAIKAILDFLPAIE